MSGTFFCGRRGNFEALERRELLAGDVLVSVVHGDLKITGDVANNNIAVTAGAEANTFVITGLDGTNLRLVDRATGEPGEAMSELTVTARGDVKIRLGEGNDMVAVTDANVRGKLSVHTGDGDDTVEISNEVAAALNGNGDGLGVLLGFRGGVNVDTGDGADEVSVTNAVRGRFSVDTGDGDDSVSLSGEGEGDASLRLGSVLGGALGFRASSSVHVNLGEGNDDFTLANVETSANVHVNGGSGDDTIDVDSLTARVVSVLGGEGADSVSLANVEARHAGVFTGVGDDTVSLTDSVFASLGVMLGDDDDSLATGGLDVRLAAFLGGDGEDTLEELAASNLVHNIVNGFELGDIGDNVEELSRRTVAELRDLVGGLGLGCVLPSDLGLPRFGLANGRHGLSGLRR
jgi:hypothetical protein